MTAPLTPKTLAARWSVSEQKVRRMCRKGELCCFKVGNGFRITPHAVAEYEARSWQPSESIEANASSNGPSKASEVAPSSQSAGQQAAQMMRDNAKGRGLPSTGSNVAWMHSKEHRTQR